MGKEGGNLLYRAGLAAATSLLYHWSALGPTDHGKAHPHVRHPTANVACRLWLKKFQTTPLLAA